MLHTRVVVCLRKYAMRTFYRINNALSSLHFQKIMIFDFKRKQHSGQPTKFESAKLKTLLDLDLHKL